MRISDWSSDVCSSDLDRGGFAGARIFDLGVDQRHQPRSQVARRHADELKMFGLDIAGDVIEHMRGIATDARIGGEETEISIYFRGYGLVIAGPEKIGRASCRERVWKYV